MNTPGGFPLHHMLITLLRVTLGCVFIVASIDKIADPYAFAASIGNYKIVSGTPAMFVATILPWIELLAGLGLLFGVFLRGSALLTLIMLATFTILASSAMLRGLDISCGCFTQDPASSKVGWTKIAENLLLIAINIIVFSRSSEKLSLDRFVRQRQ